MLATNSSRLIYSSIAEEGSSPEDNLCINVSRSPLFPQLGPPTENMWGERERAREREETGSSQSELALLMPPPNGHSGGGVSLYVRENCWKGAKKTSRIANRLKRLGKPLPFVFVSVHFFFICSFFFSFIHCKPVPPDYITTHQAIRQGSRDSVFLIPTIRLGRKEEGECVLWCVRVSNPIPVHNKIT